MARRRGNKSEAIRRVLAEHPKAKSKEIVALLAGQGVKVNATLVYYVKSRAKHARRKQNRAARLSGEMARNPVKLVQRLKEIAGEVGGWKNLRQLVDLVAD